LRLRFVDQRRGGAKIEGALLAFKEVFLKGFPHFRGQLPQEVSFRRHHPDCIAMIHRQASCSTL
jgi:hypothetical protein